MQNVTCWSAKWSYWQAAVIQRDREQFKHTAAGEVGVGRGCHSHSPSDPRDLVQDRVLLRVTYEVSAITGSRLPPKEEGRGSFQKLSWKKAFFFFFFFRRMVRERKVETMRCGGKTL